MIVIIAALLGALIGTTTAKRRGGRLPDILQYAVGYALAFTVAGVILTLVIEKSLT
ncbi:hypothetical protein N6L24_03640 [Cognatishimia sp. SS12]|uniref:hypothetical protein n=1 Tax=Cognatishimia sp. SS12 TaxID=2979465 RepID=UPI00232EC4F7|nr:hypothetical protein [Cognatishimia sp. SS12]MDC0737358.1 hypothetical protein [Cognatishimia sp. SS12]